MGLLCLWSSSQIESGKSGLPKGQREMSSKLFVGGLALATTEESLRALFESCGEVVEAKVITDRETGRSRGFGFVTYADDDQARAAVEELSDTELDGRTIRVDLAQERRDGGGRGGRGGGGGGGGGGGYGGGGYGRR